MSPRAPPDRDAKSAGTDYRPAVSAADDPRREGGHGSRPRVPDASPQPGPPGPSGGRDRWLPVALLALVPLVLHTLGAPLGEPAAEDWDFLHQALLAGGSSFFDGGGSSAFWRPLPHQVYFALAGPLMLSRPLALGVLHLLALALTAVLIHRAARTRMPAAWAAVVAGFPLLAEAARALITWPDHMVELSFLLGSALALHEAAYRRMPTALAALLAALLCKEVAVATALLLPWVPRPGPGAARERWRWVAGTAAVTLAWAVVYLAVRGAHHLHLPHALETAPGTVGTPWLVRLGWVALNSLRAAFSLPMAGDRWEPLAWGGLLALGAAAGAVFAARPEARARLARVRPLVLFGLAWFALAAMPLTLVYPFWMPHRAVFGGIGLALALVAVLGSARPALLAGLVALRLVLFLASPGPPPAIAPAPPATGAFLDFQRIVRLQRVMMETRQALAARHPTLPAGARVGLHHPALGTEYAFGENRALQVWYRDTTLRWVRYEDFRRRPELPLAAVVHYEPGRAPAMMLLEPEAMRRYLTAGARVRREDWRGALADLAAADSLQADTSARVFRGRVAGRRALALLGLGDAEAAAREARRGLALWREGADARYSLASVLALGGGRAGAEAHLDTLLTLYPGDAAARALRDSLGVWAAPGR